jgi:transposase InsO family protein
MDKLTKSAHFIPVRDTYNVTDVAREFISEVIHLYGIPKKIISDRDSRFTSRFWTSLQSTLGTQLNLSTAYHPETDGQTERVNQVMEDMLRMYVMDNQTQWEKYLLWYSLPTITIIIVPSECHHTKLCMEGHAEHH